MVQTVKLGTKFTVVLTAIFMLVAIASLYLIKDIEYEESTEEAIYHAELLLESMVAVRNYTSEHLNQYLEPLQETEQFKDKQFIRESAPSFAANTVFEILKKNNPEYQGFEYKEASLNPTNRHMNLADEFEIELIQQFLKGGESELTGPRSRNGQQLYYVARPIKVKPSCLHCHTTPDVAPRSMLATYGSEYGFGWKEGEVIAMRMVYVPLDNVHFSGVTLPFMGEPVL